MRPIDYTLTKMSSDSEAEDIFKSLAVGADGFDSDSDVSSDSEQSDADVIHYSDEESADSKSFPSLELDAEKEDDQDEQEDDLKSYFTSGDKVLAGIGAKKASGTFAGMGLSQGILKNISKRGYKIPTPIQRKTIPLIMDGRDVVGMARTGSGKTAAFVLPMIEKLKVHTAKVGTRAVILSPSRELALQTLKVVKEFSKGSDLRSVLLVGGDSLEEQFGFMMSNPDIVIATPGRFLHLKVEMSLDLKSVEYIVFDEADRLFELGFAEQLNEILASLKTSRQSLLFSATLPNSLVEFAKAGLQDPTLVRLDAESKISDQLEMAYFSVKDSEREAALLTVLRDVIKMPEATKEQLEWLNRTSSEEGSNFQYDDDEKNERRKNWGKRNHSKEKIVATELPSPNSTIIFVPTKHHVDFIYTMLCELGFAVSYIYGSLDQVARKNQLYAFRTGKTSILVVTDVAARGIDIPVLANVINFNIPSSPKVFIHRVGRTARAGRRGWAYTLVMETELAYLLELELFLGRKLLLPGSKSKETTSFTERLVLGALPRSEMDLSMEQVSALLDRDFDLRNMGNVAARGEKLYLKTRNKASAESSKRAKEVIASGKWDSQHVLFGNVSEESVTAADLLARLGQKRKRETVFEIKNGAVTGDVAMLMKRRREQIAPIQRRAEERKRMAQQEKEAGIARGEEEEAFENLSEDEVDNEEEEDVDIAKNGKKKSFKDSQYYISHYAPNSAEEKAYSLDTGFAGAAQGASFELQDEGKDFGSKQIPSTKKWDKKRGKYVSEEAGGKDLRYIKGESGARLPATYRSGRFDSWKSAHKNWDANENTIPSGKKFKHNKFTAPKDAIKGRDDYNARRKRVQEAVASGMKIKGYKSNSALGIRSVDEVRKGRELKEKRREKNARPSKKRK